MPPDQTVSLTVVYLDDTLALQGGLNRQYAPRTLDMSDWGGRIRLGCRPGQYAIFARDLQARMARSDDPNEVPVVLYGSGDFHHVSLALLMRRQMPFNLLVLDKHPDWMRYVPIMHCGTWLNHAARLPQVRHVYHVGGDMDFDNAYRLLAPRDLLRRGRIRVFPAVRRFTGGLWSRVRTTPVRSSPDRPASAERVRSLFEPYAAELAACPLYVSVDKDVLAASEAVTNWDAGCLLMDEVLAVLSAFLEMAGHRLVGADITGDGSPFGKGSCLPRALAWLHGPRPLVDPIAAAERNEKANLQLLARLRKS